MALPLGLLAGGRNVGARGVHVHRSVGASSQKLVMHGPDAATDLEDRAALDPAGRQGLDQSLGQTRRAVATVVTQVVLGVAGIELAIVCAAVHATDATSRSRASPIMAAQ